MKGLIYKDLYILGKQYKVILLAVAILALIPNSSMGMVALVYAAILPISTMAMDEQSGWTRLAAAMPMPRRRLVLSKYLLGVICALGAALLSALGGWVGALFQGRDFGAGGLADTGGMLAVALCLQAVSMPLMFKWGVEKGRLLMTLVMAVGAGGIVALNTAAPGALGAVATDWSALAALSVLALAAMSMWISVRVFDKRAL